MTAKINIHQIHDLVHVNHNSQNNNYSNQISYLFFEEYFYETINAALILFLNYYFPLTWLKVSKSYRKIKIKFTQIIRIHTQNCGETGKLHTNWETKLGNISVAGRDF